MEDKDLVGGNLGSVGKYDVAFKGGQLVAEVDANIGSSSAGIVVKIDAKQILDAIKAKIPGQIDDAIINIIEAALLA